MCVCVCCTRTQASMIPLVQTYEQKSNKFERQILIHDEEISEL